VSWKRGAATVVFISACADGSDLYLVYRSRQTRVASLALAAFSLTYAFFAWFVGGMAFADDWL
jgi:hypothetical protein